MSWDQPEKPSPEGSDDRSEENFERELASRLSYEFLREQRRNRRWGIFFKFLAFAYVSVFLILSAPGKISLDAFDSDQITALVDLQASFRRVVMPAQT